MWLGVEPAGGGNQHNAGRSYQKEDRRFTLARPLTLQNESSGKPGEGECGPGKNGEEPWLRCTQVVDAVDIGFQRPRQPARLPVRPQRRREQRNQQSCSHSGKNQRQSGLRSALN